MAKAKRLPVDTERFVIEAKKPLFLRASGVVDEVEFTEKKLKQPKKVSKKEPKPKQQQPKKVSDADLVLCNFRLRNDQIIALGIRHVETKENYSGMVREAIEMYLGDYLKDKTVNLHLSITSAKTPENAFESKGLRMSQEIIEAVDAVSSMYGFTKSVIVRNAIDEYLTLKDAN